MESKFPFFEVVELSGDNVLLNADNCETGVGATVNPWVGGDDILKPREIFSADFVIGLRERKPFKFFVNVLGYRWSGPITQDMV